MLSRIPIRTRSCDEAIVVSESHQRLGQCSQISFERTGNSFTLPFKTIT